MTLPRPHAFHVPEPASQVALSSPSCGWSRAAPGPIFQTERGGSIPARTARALTVTRLTIPPKRDYLTSKMMHPTSASASPAGEGETLQGQSLALKLWVVMSRANNALSERLQASVSAHDLTLTEFGILEVLFHKGPLLLGEVQRRILVSSGGVTYLVDRLEKKGLVVRRECPGDRRARYAALTEAGEELIQRIFPSHAARIESLMSPLSEEEQRVAVSLLRRIGRSADAERQGER
jgi:MarR family transcriptional regulator, 2-MHQ and catechol-resistance regulon repressor